MTEDELDQKAAIVLAGITRLGAVEGFPVTDYALVAETDLDLEEVRDCLRNQLSGARIDVAPGEHEGSVQVMGIQGGDEVLPDLGNG